MYDFAEYDYYDFQDAQEMQDAYDDGWEYEDDGQPSEYEEWQDYMGGDDWNFGQYDHYEDY